MVRPVFAGLVLAGFRAALAPIAAITVTGAAFAAFTAIFRAGAALRWVAGILNVGRAGFSFGGHRLGRSKVCLTTLTAFTATFTATFTAAFARWALWTGLCAVGKEFLRVVGTPFCFALGALLVAAIATTFAGRALTPFCTLSAHGAAIGFAAFDAGLCAAFGSCLCSAFTAPTAFAAFTPSTIAATSAVFSFAAFTTRLAASFTGFFIFLDLWRGHRFLRGAAKEVFQPAKETP